MEGNISYYYQLIFKKIFSVSTEILNEYKKLAELERNGQKNSSYYAETLANLNELLKQEDNCYEAIKSNSELVNNLLHKIAYFNKNSNDFVIPKNSNSLVYCRMSLKLNDLLTKLNRNKSLDIFVLFGKFDLFSLLHFENVLLALILFRNYLNIYPTPLLEDSLTYTMYSYSFMFPYIEETILKDQFNLPNDIYSSVDYYGKSINISAEDITKYKRRKFQQIKKYMLKHTLGSNDYLFLLFYLKALSSSLDDELVQEFDELLKRLGISRDIKNVLRKYLQNEDATKLVRKVSFAI